MAPMTGAEAIVKMLKAAKVEYVFGLPGSTELVLLDALVAAPEIKYIGAAHEAIALAMADGYARASGKVGVVVVHSTAGTTNILGLLRSSRVTDVPLVVIAGAQDTRYYVEDPLNDCDLVQLTSQFTKWSWRVACPEDLPKALLRAFKVATTAPHGPVYIAVPENIQAQQVDFEAKGLIDYTPVRIRGDREQVLKAAQMLADAQSPAILAGYQVAQADAIPELVELAELLAARVYVPPGGSSYTFPTGHPLYSGWSPVLPATVEQFARSFDTIFMLGAKGVQQRYAVTEAALHDRRVVQADANPWEIGKNYPVDAAIIADPKSALQDILIDIKPMLNEGKAKAIHQRYARIKAEKAKERADLERDYTQAIDSSTVRVPRLMIELRNAMPANTSFVSEAVYLSEYIVKQIDFSEPGSYFQQYVHLGWGLGAAIGVALALPDRKVVLAIGEGSAMFGIQALWSIARYKVPVTVIVLNNGCYMAVKAQMVWRKGPAAKTGNYLSCDLGEVNVAKMAEAFGIPSKRVQSEKEVGKVLADAFKRRGPQLIDIAVDPKDTGYARPRLP